MKRLGKEPRVKIYESIGQSPSDGHDFIHRGLSAWEPDVFAFLADRMRP